MKFRHVRDKNGHPFATICYDGDNYGVCYWDSRRPGKNTKEMARRIAEGRMRTGSFAIAPRREVEFGDVVADVAEVVDAMVTELRREERMEQERLGEVDMERSLA